MFDPREDTRDRGEDASPQMPTGERDAGTGLQVLLERDGAPLVRKLDHGVDAPRSMLDGMSRAPGVVRIEAPSEIGRQSGVVPRRRVVVLENVDDSLGLLLHTACRAMLPPSTVESKKWMS